MDPLLGAVIAAATAWLSIAVAALLPMRIPVRRLRWVGGASIAAVGLASLGVALPAWSAIAILVGGVAAAVLIPEAQVAEARRR